MTDRCEIPRCKHPAAVFYLERGVCEWHWNRYMADDAPPDSLKMALGIEAAPTTKEEPMVETDSIAAETAATEDKMTEKKASKPRAVKKTKAAKTKAKPAKAKPPKKERPPKETLVVFAFRLTPAERDAIHKTAGPRNATQFVRRVAVAFASEDEASFRSVVKDARALRS